MFKVPKTVSGFDGALSYVDTCPNQPEHGMAFCHVHCKVASENNIPCKLSEFLSKQHGNIQSKTVNIEH